LSFAAYLAKYYVGRKGFSPGTVPEAAPLVGACDIVLTRSDGMSLQIVCIVDRETNPQKTFGLSGEMVQKIGQECLKYTGKVSGTQMPVMIQVIEVAGGAASEQDHARLGAYRKASALAKVQPSAWSLDTAAGTVWTNAPFGGLFYGARALRQLLRAPRIADADLRQPEIALARERFPLVTIALLAVLAAVFACELAFGIGEWSGMLAPSIQTLIALGGLNKTLVLAQGEWSRVFSAALLHGNIAHLALNGLCLYLAGMALESFVGRRWFFALFVIGALGGSLMSLAINPPSIVSVGASGAIMGLLAAAFVCSFRYPSGAARMQIQMTTLQVLIPGLIPLAVTGQRVDFAGHVGGALSGLVVGLVLLRTWRADSTRPAFLSVAAIACVGGALAFAWSAWAPLRDYQGYTLDTLLIPNAQLPKSRDEARAKAADFMVKYPRDPRSRLYQAQTLIDQQDLPGAERELRAGLAEHEILRTKFKPEFEATLQGMLALVLYDSNQRAEARSVAQSTCGVTAPSFGPMRELLFKVQLCEK
jgi:rhomboid protease GluP